MRKQDRAYRLFTILVLIFTHLGAVALGLALAQHNLWLVR